ncbi:MAG: hypothetical protein Q7K57_44815 [Burkholderiaceae bacterium]|nr:hypothetical protein [Burkholderiaceae bacterium]
MKATTAIATICIALTGCAAPSKQPIWSESSSAATHPDVVQQKQVSQAERDLARCRMQSAMLPGPAPRQYIPGITPNAMAPGAAGQDLGAAMQSAATQMQFMDDCMKSMGYSR